MCVRAQGAGLCAGSVCGAACVCSVRARACARRYTEAGRELTALLCGHRNQHEWLSAAGDLSGLDQRSSLSAGRPGADDRSVAAFANEPVLPITCQ